MIEGRLYSGWIGASLPAADGCDSHDSSGSMPRCQERVTASGRNGLSQPWKYPAIVGFAPTLPEISSTPAQLNGDWVVYRPKYRLSGWMSVDSGGAVGLAAGVVGFGLVALASAAAAARARALAAAAVRLAAASRSAAALAWPRCSASSRSSRPFALPRCDASARSRAAFAWPRAAAAAR